MTTTKRRRRLAGAIAIAVPLGLVVLGTASWMAAGPRPVEDRTIELPLPAPAGVKAR